MVLWPWRMKFTLVVIFTGSPAFAESAETVKVLTAARSLLELGQISYTYGGHSVAGDLDVCEKCAVCLDSKHPAPRQRVAICPSCQNCSLDCSHYIALVFKRAGLPIPYLDTATMLRLSPSQLLRRYRLLVVDDGVEAVQPGDLLVYRGHVAMAEAVRGQGYGDILHATSGRAVKGGGHGVQRARQVPFHGVRGPVLRVLRHLSLQMPGVKSTRHLQSRKLRPVKKRRPVQSN